MLFSLTNVIELFNSKNYPLLQFKKYFPSVYFKEPEFKVFNPSFKNTKAPIKSGALGLVPSHWVF